MPGKAICIAVVIALLTISAHAARPDGKKGKPRGDSEPAPPPALFVAFATDKVKVAAGEDITLSWASSGARSCNASGAWEGKMPVEYRLVMTAYDASGDESAYSNAIVRVSP